MATTDNELDGFLAGVKKTLDTDGKAVAYRKQLSKAYWDEAPITKAQHSEYTTYEQEYVKQGIDSLKAAHNADDVVKATLYMSVPGNKTVTVRTNKEANLRNPSTGETSVGVTARVSVKVAKSIYKDELNSLIDELK